MFMSILTNCESQDLHFQGEEGLTSNINSFLQMWLFALHRTTKE
jgi:hypothetical protein